MFRNPVLLAELRRAYRSPRVFFSRAAFAAALVAVLAIGFRTGGSQARGRMFFYLVVLSEAALAYLTAPAFCAGALASERRGGTLAILLTTGLSPREIVFGKLLGRGVLVALMIAAAAPVLAATWLGGGVAPFEVAATSLLILSGAVLLTAVSLYAAAVGATFFGALLAAYLGFILHEVASACCLLPLGKAVQAASDNTLLAGPGDFYGSHVVSLVMLFTSPQEYGPASLLATLAVAFAVSAGLAALAARHLQVLDLPPPPAAPTAPSGRSGRPRQTGPGRAPLFWLEVRSTPKEFLIVPFLLALYGVFVLLLLLLGNREELAKPEVQAWTLGAAMALPVALLLISGANAFARPHEDGTAAQLLVTPMTGPDFVLEQAAAAARIHWPFLALPGALLLAMAAVGGPALTVQGFGLSLLAIVAAYAMAYAIGAIAGLRMKRRGPGVSLALSVGVVYWLLCQLFVAFSALAENPIALWIVRAANPFYLVYAALADGTGTDALVLGPVQLSIAALLLTAVVRVFPRLAGRVE
ncbi:MAG: ABC transporter permease subunit [Planctomycetales bacterium]|nr:ABC transporter permease subunit [Planctomycetales bacterium]